MTMSAEATAAIAVLEELAIRLGAEGWQVQLHAPPDRRPMLHVTNPRVTVLSELVTADLDADGRWWFWWSWAERISRADDLDRAAGVISRVLAAGHQAQLAVPGGNRHYDRGAYPAGRWAVEHPEVVAWNWSMSSACRSRSSVPGRC